MRALIDDIKNVFSSDPRETVLRELATNRGWKFNSRKSLSKREEWTQAFKVFKGSKSKRLVGVIRIPTDEIDSLLRVYDYTYYGDFGKKKTTIMEYHYPGMQLSSFKILPKGALLSFKNMFITEVYSFATTPDFNKRYQLIISDETAIKNDLNEDFLDVAGDVAGWTYEGSGHYLLAYKLGKVIPANSLETDIERFSDMIDKLVYGLGKTELSRRNRPKS